MARIMLLDYGKKRTGIAVTDPSQIIATALTTVETRELIGFIKQYVAKEPVEKMVIGYPLNMDNSETDATALVDKFILKFSHVFPNIPVEKIDERFSSKLASAEIAKMGLKKKESEQKELIDAVAAAMMLQEWMESR